MFSLFSSSQIITLNDEKSPMQQHSLGAIGSPHQAEPINSSPSNSPPKSSSLLADSPSESTNFALNGKQVSQTLQKDLKIVKGNIIHNKNDKNIFYANDNVTINNHGHKNKFYISGNDNMFTNYGNQNYINCYGTSNEFFNHGTDNVYDFEKVGKPYTLNIFYNDFRHCNQSKKVFNEIVKLTEELGSRGVHIGHMRAKQFSYEQQMNYALCQTGPMAKWRATEVFNGYDEIMSLVAAILENIQAADCSMLIVPGFKDAPEDSNLPSYRYGQVLYIRGFDNNRSNLNAFVGMNAKHIKFAEYNDGKIPHWTVAFNTKEKAQEVYLKLSGEYYYGRPIYVSLIQTPALRALTMRNLPKQSLIQQ